MLKLLNRLPRKNIQAKYKMNISDRDRGKAIKLLSYLIELARIRSKITREVNDYKSVFFLNEIPANSKNCFTRAWGPNEEYNQDVWIEIKKYKQPPLDEVPKICSEWIKKSILYNTDNIPELYQTISIQEEVDNPDWDSSDPKSQKTSKMTSTLGYTATRTLPSTSPVPPCPWSSCECSSGMFDSLLVGMVILEQVKQRE